MKVVVTGGAGFIGSSLIKHILRHSDVSIVNVDCLTYAGNLSSLDDCNDNKKYKFLETNIVDQDNIYEILQREKPNIIMHLAAESHVDRSIDGPLAFMETNILGTFSLLEATRKYIKKTDNKILFHHISTDEVFGSLGRTGFFSEESHYSPNSPYSASKASADHLVRSWGSTYNIPYLITNCSNNYGPFQHPEKLIPATIINAVNGNEIKVYGTGENIRDWLYVEDHAEALWMLANNCGKDQTYCIGGNNEKTNLEVVQKICHLLNKIIDNNNDFSEQIRLVEDRPGHDMRYAIDTKKIQKDHNWQPRETFYSGLEKTINWYLKNETWCEAALKDNPIEERMGLNPK